MNNYIEQLVNEGKKPKYLTWGGKVRNFFPVEKVKGNVFKLDEQFNEDFGRLKKGDSFKFDDDTKTTRYKTKDAKYAYWSDLYGKDITTNITLYSHPDYVGWFVEYDDVIKYEKNK